MRISDWSSDVCSSDLLGVIAADRVIDEVRAIRADGFLELARQRLRRILVARLAAIDDDLVGARSSRDVGFLFARHPRDDARAERSEEHTSELQSLMRNSYADFCLKKNTN